MDKDKWHWQEEGKAWKGVGIYHVTLTIPSREPLLGKLEIPENDPKQAKVELSPFGLQIKACVDEIPQRHPEIRIIQLRMMPDHIHVILYVTRTMSVGIMTVVRGLWQGAKKIGRKYTTSINSNNIRDNERCNPNDIRNNESCFPIFTEMPFIRTMSHKGQLQTMIRYVQMNPQRLATKRLKPECFCVQDGIKIAGRMYRGVGNVELLDAEKLMPVHVRRTMVDEAMHGDARRLQDYMNGCVLEARKGVVMVSPFISPKEKEVMDVLLKEGLPFIYIADNGFRDYYKPQEALFDAVAAKRVLILSSWEYDAEKKHVSRADCVAMNKMAEEICADEGDVESTTEVEKMTSDNKHLFICLANSFKYGGRCIAGIEIKLAADEKSFRVVSDDGEPRWIRPVQQNTENEEISLEMAQNIRIMDVIEIETTEACGEDCQSENVYFSHMKLIKRLPFSPQIIQALLSKREYVLHSDKRHLHHAEYQANKGSLMLIEPEEPEIFIEYKEENGRRIPKYRARFVYKGTEYKLPITDPRYLERMEGYSKIPLIGQFETGTFYFTISITAHANENNTHTKLVAGIIDTRSVEADSQQDARNESLPYYLAEQFAMHTNRPMFITGKAGTGKTTFLRKLREQSPKHMAVVAPTGVAAINAGGMTIHSFFQLPTRIIPPTLESYRHMFSEQRMFQRKRNMLYHLEMLVIDEISMVRADVLDAIDQVLRRYKYRRDIPFGGVHVVMIGDLFQLSPVVKQGEEEELMAKYYAGPYFFQAKVMQEVQPIYVELDHVFRQQDEQFVRLLNEVRENQLTKQGRALLNSRYNPRFKNTDEDFHITLTTHNRSADELNERELNRLPGEEQIFHADIKKDFPENIYPTEETLTLKVGARVMFVRNDDQKPRRFYNGKIGVITDIDDGKIFVQCEDGDIEVGRMVWENIRYREDEKTGKIEEEVLGTFTQYPLRLAWAVTIHKSQGLTFDKVIIDAARAFAAGQVYVALSRCRTLEGIVLSTPLDYVELDNDPSVLRYTSDQPTVETVNQALPQAKKEYEVQLFGALFDFHRMMSLVEQMRKIVVEKVSFTEESLLFVDNLRPKFSEWQTVADKFRPQLTKLLLAGDRTVLQQRLLAASLYFLPLMEDVAKQVANHPCRSKNKADVSDFEPLLNDLFLGLHEKIHLMRSFSKTDCPSSESLLQARNTFIAPMADLQPIMEKPVKKAKGEGRKAKVSKKKTEPKSNVDDMAVEAMIHDMLEEGKPSPFLLDFINMIRQKKGDGLQVTSDGTNYAGQPWKVEDDLRLRELFLEGTSIPQLAQEFHRTQGAIISRLKKLGLTE